MRKEVVWAILAGITFGLVIAFGIMRVNSSVKPKGEATEATPTPVANQEEFKIVIDKPENEDVTTQDYVEVSGLTKPHANIVVSTEEVDYLTSSDDKGLFTQSVDLIAGVNRITVTAISESSFTSTSQVIVIYSSAFEVKEADRLEAAANKPKGYLGTVTDITDSTIQIKSTTSEIKQISVGEDVSVVKTDPTQKIVKLTDIAIGDFIVAMGYKNSKGVLTAQRILITPAVASSNIKVTQSKGSEVTPDKKTLVYTFSEDKLTKSKITAIEDENSILAVTAQSDSSKTTLRTVFILP